MHDQSFEWLRDKQAELEADAQAGVVLKASFHLQGISCVGCVWLIEKLFLRHDGAVRATAESQRGELRLHWIAGKLSLAEVANELQRHGYLLSPESTVAQSASRELLTRLALCGAFALNSMLFTLPRYLGLEDDFPLANLFSLLTLLFSTLSLVTGGSYFMTRAVRALRRGVMHIDLPIALGLLFAYLGSLIGWFLGEERFLSFDFVGVFTFLILAGRWLQERAVDCIRSQIARHYAEPKAVTRLTPLGEERVPPQALAIGDEIEIARGETVPATGELVSTEANFSLEWIKGEPEPRHFPQNSVVPAGAASLERATARLRVTEPWNGSLLAQLLKAPESADGSKTMERVLQTYLSVILALAVIGGFVWGFLLHDPFSAWNVALSVLIISCPCALSLALPLIDELAITRLRARGVFVKNYRLFGNLTQIRKPEALEEDVDLYILSHHQRGILDLIRVSKIRMRAVRVSLSFAIAYNIIAVGSCLAGHINPLLAAILLALSSLLTLGIVHISFAGELASTDPNEDGHSL
jgi:Cu2+-exporting ATPase|tara:strand:+ start:1023 stop:2603 length:1581 start_codon:yes stop_codon:yes gene_type:complete